MKYLPVITEDDTRKLADECGVTEDSYIEALVIILRRFFETQDALGDVLERYAKLYGKEKWFNLLTANVYKMYRLLELAHERLGLKMPIVKAEVGAPIQEEIFRSIRKGPSYNWFQERAKEIVQRNPKALVEVGWDIVLKGLEKTRGHCLILAACVSIYQMIESQLQADELNVQFAGQ